MVTKRFFCRDYNCLEHRSPEEPDARELALIEERLRDEYAGEAAMAALEMKQEEDRRESQRRAEEEAREAMEEPIKEACKILASECLKCAECLDRNFAKRLLCLLRRAPGLLFAPALSPSSERARRPPPCVRRLPHHYISPFFPSL